MEVKVVLVGGPHPGKQDVTAGRHVRCFCHLLDGEYEFTSVTQDGPPHVATYTWSQHPDREVQLAWT